MTDTTERRTYPGRPELNAANARARKAFAAVFKEGVRFDAALLPELEKLVNEAAETLNRIASDAEQLETTSQRHQRELKRLEDKQRASLRKLQRRGSTRATELLARLDQRAAQRGRPADDAAEGTQ